MRRPVVLYHPITREALVTAVREAVMITVVVSVGVGLLIHHREDGFQAVRAIQAALGSDSVAPANSKVITKLLADVQGNWYWFLLGTLPLALAVLLGAVALGVRSASDWLFRLLLGIVGIIAFAPAIVA